MNFPSHSQETFVCLFATEIHLADDLSAGNLIARFCSKVFCWSLNVNEVDEFLRCRTAAAFPLSLYLQSKLSACFLSQIIHLTLFLRWMMHCYAAWANSHVRALSISYNLQHTKAKKAHRVCYLRWCLGCMLKDKQESCVRAYIDVESRFPHSGDFWVRDEKNKWEYRIVNALFGLERERNMEQSIRITEN